MRRLGIVLLVLELPLMATGDEVQSAPQPVDVVLQVLDQGDLYAACREIEARRAPAEAAELYHVLAQRLYQPRRDVRRMIAVSHFGIHFALSSAERLEAGDREAAAALRGRAKAIAYDLGANLWPGWQDEGIVLSESDLATGREAARLNLRLAEELGRPPLPRCNAEWLLGAHELAIGASEPARECFTRGRRLAEEAERPEYVRMCEGYAAVARMQAEAEDEGAREDLEKAIESLRTMKTDDSSFFADQLESVRTLFVPARP